MAEFIVTWGITGEKKFPPAFRHPLEFVESLVDVVANFDDIDLDDWEDGIKSLDAAADALGALK